MKSILRWILAVCLLLLLIVFPRGAVDSSGSDYITEPLQLFSWASAKAHFGNFLHELHTLTAIDGRSLMTLVLARLHVSIGMLVVGIVIIVGVGVAKGVYDGLNTRTSSALTVTSDVLQMAIESMPDFFVASGLLLLAFFWSWSHHSTLDLYGNGGFVGNSLVPGVILALMPTMYMARMVRTCVSDQLGQPYLTTAQAKGLRSRYILLRHLLPNAYPTVLSALVPAFGMMLSSLVIIQYLFNRKDLVNGIFQAMGETGDFPIYRPLDDMLKQVGSYVYDPGQILAYVLTFALLLSAAWLILHGLLRLAGHRGVHNAYAASLADRADRGNGRGQLWTGGLLLAGLTVAGVLANHLGLISPDATDPLETLKNGSLTIPPYPPLSLRHVLGTDMLGHDLLSQAVHGILPTFQIVGGYTAAIILVSILLAMLSSVWNIRPLRYLIETWNRLFRVIPGVIAALLILNIPDVYWAGSQIEPSDITWSWVHTAIVAAVICVIEVGRVSANFQFALDDLGKKTYMEAAEISGNSPWGKFRRHYFRTFLEVMLDEAIVVMIRVLVLIATLGFFIHPLAQEWILQDTGWEYAILSHDWGSLIASNVHRFMEFPWFYFAPILFITLTTVSLSLLRIGLGKALRVTPTRTATPVPEHAPPGMAL